MGIIKQGILGGFQNKVGSVVGSSWKGIAVMKAKPISVANPKTAGQVAQRTKFKNASAFASTILATICKPLWDRFAQQMSGYNAFVQKNIELFVSELPVPAGTLVISQGKMDKTIITTVDAPKDDQLVQISWDDDTGEGFKLSDDDSYAVCINERTKEVVSAPAHSERNNGIVALAFSENNLEGDVVNCYLAFRRKDGTIVSNTSYFVAVVPA